MSTTDWFERLTGFREAGYDDTRERLAVEDGHLVSRVNGARYGIGRLEVLPLQELRDRAGATRDSKSRTTVRCMAADVRALHRSPDLAAALFQVASQFNLLEMTSPQVRPEDGVTRYAFDRTQGPACAIAAGAAGAATIYRNYFAPVGDGVGQRAD